MNVKAFNIYTNEIKKSLQDISDTNDRMIKARDMIFMLRRELLLGVMKVMFESVEEYERTRKSKEQQS